MAVPGCAPPAVAAVESWSAASYVSVVTAVPESGVVAVIVVRLPAGSYVSASVEPSG